MHFFYLLRCSDDSLYAGTCIDPAERLAMHNAGKGSKYVRSRLPATMVYIEEHETLSAARKREAEVKRWTREGKEALIARRIKKARSQRASS